MKIFTLAHLAISLAGILSGFVVLVVQSFFYVPVLKAIAPTPARVYNRQIFRG